MVKIMMHGCNGVMGQNFWLGFDVAEENLYLKGVNIVPWEDGAESDLSTSYK